MSIQSILLTETKKRIKAEGVAATLIQRIEGTYDTTTSETTPTTEISTSIDILLFSSTTDARSANYNIFNVKFATMAKGLVDPEEGDFIEVDSKRYNITKIEAKGTSIVIAFKMTLTRA